MKRLALLLLTAYLSVTLLWGQRVPLERPMVERLMRLRPEGAFAHDAGYRLLDGWLDSATFSDGSGSKLLPSLLLGADLYRSPRWALSVDGLLNTVVSLDKPNGLWLSYEVQGVWQPAPRHRLMMRSTLNYTLRSRQWYHTHNLFYYFAPERNGLLLLSGGRTAGDVVKLSPTEVLTGEYWGMVGTNSPVRHYVRDFLALRSKVLLGSRLRLSLLGLYEHRKPLPLYAPDFGAHRALLAEVDAVLRLGQRAVRAERWGQFPSPLPLPMGYAGAELGVRLRRAFAPSAWSASAIPTSQYTMLEGCVRGAATLSPTKTIAWSVVGGGFLDRASMTDADLRYLPTEEADIRRPLREVWVTLPDTYAPAEHWATAGIQYAMAGLLLPKRWGIGRLTDEALHLRGAYSDRGGYMEAGYSLGLGDFARVGLFAGTDFRAKVPNFSLAITLPIVALLSTWSERE